MPPDTSKSTESKQGRRTFTEAKKAKILEYFAEHGNAETLKKFHLNYSVLARWRKEAGVSIEKASPAKKTDVLSYASARRIKRMARAQLSGEGDIERFCVEVILLCKEVMGE